MTNTETIQSLIDSGEGYNVEFKVRVPLKVRELTEEICAFANADGGYLLIGVDDNGQIIGTGLENDKRSAIQGSISEISPALHCDMYAVNIEDKTVWVIDVPSGKDKPYIFSGSIFVREGANSQKLRTVEEMRSFFQECNKIFFDAIPCSWFNIYTDADEQAIKDFRTEAKLSPSTANKQIFENLELFTDNGVAKNGAAMFFGKQPERKFPHAVTRCVLFKGTTKVYIIDDKTFGGPLYQQYLQAMAWLESKLQVAYKIEGAGPREEIWEIPLTVFKEAIINALSHRDYYEQGATITIEMFDDRVEVSNPGGLLPIVAKDFGHKSMTRNPLIFGLFTRMHLVERVASGIPRMQEAMKEANLPEPDFHTDGMFTVIFKRGISIKNDTVNDTVNSKEKEVLKIIQKYPGLNSSKIAELIKKSIPTAKRHLNSLVKSGLIEFRGAQKTGGVLYYKSTVSYIIIALLINITVWHMNTDETINKEELTLQNTPKAVNYLINEIAEMRVLLEHIESQLGLGVDKHRPINIEKACQILNQTKNGINKMVRNRTIPHYIQGNKVYFFEDELIKWVEKERVATLQEKYTSKRNY